MEYTREFFDNSDYVKVSVSRQALCSIEQINEHVGYKRTT